MTISIENGIVRITYLRIVSEVCRNFQGEERLNQNNEKKLFPTILCTRPTGIWLWLCPTRWPCWGGAPCGTGRRRRSYEAQGIPNTDIYRYTLVFLPKLQLDPDLFQGQTHYLNSLTYGDGALYTRGSSNFPDFDAPKICCRYRSDKKHAWQIIF